MLKRFCILLFLLLNFSIQTPGQSNDIAVTIYESTLNKLFKAMGEINGSSEYKVLFVKGTYHWTLVNPNFRLMKDKADFVTDVKVKAGPIEYETQVLGNVDISYDKKTNLISVKVVKATFPVYTEILGRKFHIKDIELDKYFETPFTFEGPMSMKSEMEFELPDGKKKKVYAIPTNCIVKVEPQKIAVISELEFTDQPPLPPLPVAPSVTTAPVKDTTKKE